MKLSKRTLSNLATYFMGFAIGLVLVGVILSMKQKVFQQHQARQQQAQQSQPATGSTPPSGP
ncbi:MAG: hypothetical protein KDA31_01235 [Phycisphaerales bacterium]|nr:hypothetical protein [Phycisphaerales bacterium]MCB9836954.1 hypothetical protein [Phycisphaera sp.]